MADCLADGEFWLPPQFLSDEDAFIDKRSFSPKLGVDPFGAGMLEQTFGYGSDLGSPVESVLGSTENESDEEDLLADLTMKMARSTLDEGFKNPDSAFGYDNSKVRYLSGSPQSTLRPATWDLLYEAAGEVAKMRLNEELFGFSNARPVLSTPKRHTPVSIPSKAINSETARYAQNTVSYHQLLDYQIQQLKQQQMMKQQQQQRSDSGVWGPNPKANNGPYHAAQNCGRKNDYAATRNGRPLGLSPAAWPSLQQAAQHPQNGSGMRAVFLGGPAAKRECAGTGVFLPLPRRAGTQPEPRKKPACSTVLLPAKVVQALNLNLENVGPQPHLPHLFNGRDVAWNVRRNGPVVAAHQKGSVRPQPVANAEIRLPQEWTY